MFARLLYFIVFIAFSANASGAVVMVVNEFDADTLAISLSGTFENDNIGANDLIFGIKPNWSSNYGVPVDWIADSADGNFSSVNPEDTTAFGFTNIDISFQLEDFLIEGASVDALDNTYGDALMWCTGSVGSIVAGFSISGTINLGGPGVFNPSGITSFDLVLGLELDSEGGRWSLVETSAPVTPVPIPAPIWLLGSALVGLGSLKRRFS